MAEDRALAVEPDGRAVLRGNLRAADAIEGRARIGHLDEGRKADAAMDALRARGRLIGPQRLVVHHLQDLVGRGDVRQLLELDAGGGLRRMGIVGDQVLLAHLDRVHADLRRGEIDQAFGHRDRDRMPDRAVLAHDVLVLEHHARAGAVVRAGIGPAGEVDDLIGLDAAGARIDRIGADAGEVVDLEGGDGAVLPDADLALHAMVARVNVGDEAFQPVGDELDRPLQQLRQRHHRHLVGIGMHLDAERAADILGDDADLMLLRDRGAWRTGSASCAAPGSRDRR